MGNPIENKTILVTGANRGIGKAFVETFLKHGAGKVYAAARNPESAQPLVEAHGERVVPLRVDLNDPGSITQAAKSAGDAGIVIHNAGIYRGALPLDPGALDTLREEIDVNVYGLLRVAQAFAPVLKANGGGVFAQLNSVASLRSFAASSTYAASKAAAYSLTQALREQLREQGTTVVSIHPGPIATDMADDAGFGDIAEPPEQVAEAFIQALTDGEFHVYTDTLSRQFGEAYRSFAKEIVEPELAVA